MDQLISKGQCFTEVRIMGVDYNGALEIPPKQHQIGFKMTDLIPVSTTQNK